MNSLVAHLLPKIIYMSKVKKYFKLITPPIFGLLYQKVKSKKFREWQMVDTTWEEAKKKCTGYDADIILQNVKKSTLKVKNKEAVYERDSLLFDEIHYSLVALSGVLFTAAKHNGNLCVIDFGGSLGTTYFQNRFFLDHLNTITWCIVEQPNFVKCGKEVIEDEKLKFYDTMEECLKKHKPNAIIVSGMLQYTEDPYYWIKKIIDYKFETIIIDRTSLCDSAKDILAIQNISEEIYKANFPAWFMSEEKFLSYFADYTEILSSKSTAENPCHIMLSGDTIGFWKGFIFYQQKR